MTKKLIKPTVENLRKFATKPLTQWLITSALEGGHVTYGEAKRRLENEHNFSTIFSVMMGHPAGSAMDRLLQYDADIPLLNVLLVQQGILLPGEGAGAYMAERFGIPKLAEKKAPERYPNLWRQTFEKAANEVYTFDRWEDVFGEIYENWQPAASERPTGNEKDGSSGKRGGEGPHHKKLRLWVKENPQKVAPRMNRVRSETEVELYSGDRVDAVYFSQAQTLAIEVKSKDSNWVDLRRGIYQCVKYQAVLKAQNPCPKHTVKALLVTEAELEGDLKSLAKRLKIGHAIHKVNS